MLCSVPGPHTHALFSAIPWLRAPSIRARVLAAVRITAHHAHSQFRFVTQTPLNNFSTMSQVKPYKISVPEERLQKLKQKLALTDFPDELEDAEWAYGSPLSDIQRLAKYWEDGFDWRNAEAKLNEFPQYTVDIDVEGFETLSVHFLHQKSMVKGAIPLLFAHGWPGSFFEATKIMPELAKGSRDFPAFHVVAPSLPNFGFSQGTKKVSPSDRVYSFYFNTFRFTSVSFRNTHYLSGSVMFHPLKS